MGEIEFFAVVNSYVGFVFKTSTNIKFSGLEKLV